MSEDIDWGLAWVDARSRSPVKSREKYGAKWPQFWDMYAGQYMKDVMSGEADNRALINFLRAEDMLRDGDRVLDIGSGPGTYTLLLAERPGSVTALDISAVMLEMLAGEAERRGLANVETVNCPWEDYSPPGPFDLAFSAYSPAINDERSLLRMEEASSRSCCLVTAGAPSGGGLFSDLSRAVLGERPPQNKRMELYPFNLLLSKGRKPGVRFFDVDMTIEMPSDDLARIADVYLGVFTEVDDAKREAVRRYVGSVAPEGVYRKSVSNVLALIYWNVPNGKR